MWPLDWMSILEGMEARWWPGYAVGSAQEGFHDSHSHTKPNQMSYQFSYTTMTLGYTVTQVKKKK